MGVGWINETLHPEGSPQDGDCRSLIATTPDGHITLQEGILLVVIDGQHQHGGIGELRKDMAE